MTTVKYKAERVFHVEGTRSADDRDNLRPSRGVLVSIALGAAIWGLLISAVLVLTRHVQ